MKSTLYLWFVYSPNHAQHLCFKLTIIVARALRCSAMFLQCDSVSFNPCNNKKNGGGGHFSWIFISNSSLSPKRNFLHTSLSGAVPWVPRMAAISVCYEWQISACWDGSDQYRCSIKVIWCSLQTVIYLTGLTIRIMLINDSCLLNYDHWLLTCPIQ